MGHPSETLFSYRASRLTWLVAAIFCLVGLSVRAFPQSEGAITDSSSLKKLSLEELMNIEVTSVSKSPEKLFEAASAIQVITGEDINRSGATNVADALRLAPNLEVQQIASHAWAVSARGFDAVFANKLLVLIDGRSVYTPLDAGVFWDAQNVLLADLNQIEVVSGPGATLWGSNAVNGVINITTKSAKDTQGLYVSGGGGSFLQDFVALRYGDSVGTNFFYRVYVERFDRESTLLSNGSDGINSWDLTQGGFRMDYYPTTANTLTLQGDFYSGTEYNVSSGHSALDGENVLGRWTHTFSEESDLKLQLYFDRTWRHDIPSTITDDLVTYDFDFQHRFPIGEWQSILWGAGYRLMLDDTPPGTVIAGFVPQKRTMQLISAFVQDEITLVRDRLKLTIGTKLEHNDFSGFEVQPSVRLAWTPTEWQTIWGAVSRAVRSPSRIDVDYHIPTTPPYAIAGGPNFDSEKVIAYELGYRIQPIQKLSLSLAGYYNDYDDIYSVELANPPAPLPYTIQNGVDGQSWGAELSGTYQSTKWWRLRGGYTYFHKDLWNKPGHSSTSASFAALGNDPEHQFVLQSMMDLPAHFQLDVTARYVAELPNYQVPSYFTADVRIAWQYKRFEVALVGQNLFDNQHPEFTSAQEIPRSIFGKVTWRY
jgi:iron complex outermembrane receptor protein